MLRFVHMLVFALVASFGIASGASALVAKTALRGISEHGGDRVGAFDLEGCGTRPQNALEATTIASECCHAARGTGAFLEGAQGGAGLGKLAGKSINVSEKGLGIVEQHLAQFGDVPQNTAMIGRLRAALAEGRAISGADASFYMHEVAEATMMGRGAAYKAAHDAALGKYGVSPFSVYHPEVIQQFSSSFNSNWAKFWGL